MTEYFNCAKGGFTVYVPEDVAGVRFCLARHGEDATLALAQFWKENRDSDFEIAVIFSHGRAPRAELCTQRSLVAALQTANIEPGSRTEQQWKAACEAHHVAWAKRLQPKAA